MADDQEPRVDRKKRGQPWAVYRNPFGVDLTTVRGFSEMRWNGSHHLHRMQIQPDNMGMSHATCAKCDCVECVINAEGVAQQSPGLALFANPG